MIITSVSFQQTLVVIQDMLRIFIIRLCCHKADSASFLLRPIFLWIRAGVSDLSSLSDIDAYKVNTSIIPRVFHPYLHLDSLMQMYAL